MVLLEMPKNRYVYNIHIDCRPHEPELPQLRPGVDVEPGEHAGGHERGGGGEQRTPTEKAEKMEQEAVQQGE